MSDRVRAEALRVLGLAMMAVGLLSAAGYAVSLFTMNAPGDHAMAFWLLPFLLGGLALVGTGGVVLVLWLLLTRME